MNTIPTREDKPTCPQCGAGLLIEHDGIDLKGDENLLCPVHGRVGSLDEIRARILQEERNKIVKNAKQRIRDTLRGDILKPR